MGLEWVVGHIRKGKTLNKKMVFVKGEGVRVPYTGEYEYDVVGKISMIDACGAVGPAARRTRKKALIQLYAMHTLHLTTFPPLVSCSPLN